nr:MAG TPA: hypothetical protein [Caudoviricetes sp.]
MYFCLFMLGSTFILYIDIMRFYLYSSIYTLC